MEITCELLKYIENHLEDELNLELLSQKMGYSKFYLNRVFYNKVGCSIHKYIQKRRLTEAANKLVNTDIAIIDIAHETNYSTQQSFNLAFKKLYSVSPQRYRKIGIFYPKQEPLNLKSISKRNYNSYIDCQKFSFTAWRNVA